MARAAGARALIAAAVVIILAAAAWTRLARLDSQPGGLFQDEAAEGLDALRLLRQPGFHPIFFDDDGGREAPYAYMVAAAFRVLGPSVTVLRGVSGVLGVLGVLALLLALRRFGWVAALAGAAWSAGSLWLIAVDRDGFRNVLVPLFGALALWALAAWGNRPTRRRAWLAGAVCAAGLWTYQPLKLTPLLVALWLLWVRRQAGDVARARWDGLRRTLPQLLAGYLVVAAPMLLVALLDPVGYFGRAAVVAPSSAADVLSLPQHVLRTLGMFAITGDPNPRHDVAALPLLGWPLTLLAAVGAWRAWRRRAEDPAGMLLPLAIPVFLLPPLLAVEGGAPHFLRALGLAPFLGGLIGLGAAELADLATRPRRPNPARATAVAALATLLAALGLASWRAYANRPLAQRWSAYSGALIALGQAAAARPGAVLLLDDYQSLPVRFIERDHLPAIVDPHAAADPPAGATLFAPDLATLRRVLGPAAAARAVPAAWDYAGRPVGWSVSLTPSP